MVVVTLQPGTYLYHAHYGMQREAGLYGLIRVTPLELEPFAFDFDRSIILNDWYHQSTYEQAAGLSSIPFQWVGEPQSLLIHGKGRFNCSTTPTIQAGVCNSSNPECSPFLLTVIPGKTYRLRVASLTSLSALSFQIEVIFHFHSCFFVYFLLLVRSIQHDRSPVFFILSYICKDETYI